MHQSRSNPIWAVMPWVTDYQSTHRAIIDVLDQSVPTRVLLIGNGVEDIERAEMELWLPMNEDGTRSDNVLCWWADPALPSLAKTWNEGLRFVWSTGADRAWVLNNDLRVDIGTLEILNYTMDSHPDKPFFVSAVNDPARYAKGDWSVGGSRGGPDFSCFLISREMHEKYPFDENFTPAYAEDCDTHRRIMLGGDGDRMFSIPYPYSHMGSGTLNALDPERRAALETAIEQGSRTYYAKKWGGRENREKWSVPFDPTSEGLTNIELFDQVRLRW